MAKPLTGRIAAPTAPKASDDADAENGMKDFCRADEVMKTLRLDSIVGTDMATGVKYSLQAFTYNEYGWPLKRVNSLWNEGTQLYVDVEEYGFTWDEDGYCTSQWQTSDIYGYGERRDYTYDENKNGVSQTYYSLATDGSDEWIPSWRGTYKYDDRGNIVEEQISYWNADTEAWVLTQMNRSAWDGRGLQTLFEGYLWDGTDWQGTGERQEYSWLDATHITQCKSSLWNAETKEWVFYCNLEQDFDEFTNILRREKRFYNPDRDDWMGGKSIDGFTYYNELATYTYDGRGRLLTVESYGGNDDGEYVMGTDAVVEWIDNADGSSVSVETSRLHIAGQEPYVSYRTTEEFDAAGNRTRMLDEMYSYVTNGLLKDSENQCGYDDNGNMTFERLYTFTSDEANTRKPSIANYPKSVIRDRTDFVLLPCRLSVAFVEGVAGHVETKQRGRCRQED